LATTPYPLPESVRQSAVLLGDGSTTYGPFGDGWGIFDIDDVIVETRAVGTEIFAEAAATIAKLNPANAYDFFTVTFGAALSASFEFRVTGTRSHERELAVTRGGAIDGLALEKELSKMSVVLQEQRRDIDLAAVVVEGDAASVAVAAAATATAAAASSAASAAEFADALAIWCGNATGTGDAVEIDDASFAGLVAYPDGFFVQFRITAANTGGMTIEPGPLAPKPFVDRSGAAFTNGEWQVGDIAEALYSSVNNTFRSSQRVVDAVKTDQPNTFTAPQVNAEKQTFGKGVIYPPVTLADAATIAWDLDTGSNFQVTLGGNRTLGAFTNGTNGQKGTLRVIQDGTGGRTLGLGDAVYDFSGGLIEPISTGANEVTEYDWERISAGAMRLKRKWMSGRNSIGFWKDYDKGANALSTNYIQAHGLGRYPALVQAFLENTVTNLGYAVGDRVLRNSALDSGGNDIVTVHMDGLNVEIHTGINAIAFISKATNTFTLITTANWKWIMRIYE